MGAFYSKLSTRLAVLAIMSATAATPALAQFRPPPAPSPSPAPAPSPAPPQSQRTPPSVSNQPNDPTSGHSASLGGANPAFVAQGLVSCSTRRPQLPDPLTYGGDTGSAIKAISRATEHFIDQCECATQECLANALDNYAAALAQVAPQLPPELRNLPNIVSTAAHRVRAAHTRRQAVQALNVAITAVRKTIALLQADDPVTLKAGTRAGGFVAETLRVASLKLERTAGL